MARWHRATVNVGANRAGWKFVFELEPNLNFTGAWTNDVAIDDISFEQCIANRSRDVLDCDFENEFRSWRTNGLADFNWVQATSCTPTASTGPCGDHTTSKGYYMYIEASLPQKPGDRAWLASSWIPTTTSSCLVFHYHMFDDDIGTLNVIQQTSTSNLTIFTKDGSQGNIWRKGEVSVRSTLTYKIIFEGIGDIAIDDIQLNFGNCSPSAVCTFEQGLCMGWENGTDGDFKWSRDQNGSTPSGTPTVDHTSSSATGHYLFIDPTNRSIGDEAHFMSPSYIGDQPRCFRYRYHLYGAEQSKLQIQQKPEIGRPKTLWSKSTYQARVPVPPLLGFGTYKILVVGIVGSKSTGDIAIVEVECSDACTFEEDFCNWINEQNGVFDDFDWLLNSGATPSAETGPSIDHTLGTPSGTYSYIVANDIFNKSAKVWLISEHYDAGSHCLLFWYRLYGKDIGSLNVYTRIGTSQPQLQWNLSGDNGDQWRMRTINVNMGADFYFIIEGIHGGSYLADFTIDDLIVLSNLQCTIPTTTTTTSTSTTLHTGTSTTSTTTEYIGLPTTITETPFPDVLTTAHAECAEHTCYNGSICKPQVGKPLCECAAGFNGPQCETKESLSNTNHLDAILGGQFGALGAIALIIAGYMCLSSKRMATRVGISITQCVDSSSKDSTKNPAYSNTEIINA
ncbi:unnamed protein product [Rotaria magnacalcarata]|uniref:Uncharacterized protein n=1 Tax=Rotaria magnacalcarata TaxID=392030 RepID=A0A816LHY6_9BILA|nr:unnamed protein product [Rotaria magnacalcarata]